MTPLVVCQWFTSPLWAALFTFIVVFVLWVLNCIAVEIENPFGPDPNDMDCRTLHEQMNTFLLQLMSAEQERVPTLLPGVELWNPTISQAAQAVINRTASFYKVWTHEEATDSPAPVIRSCRRASMYSSDGTSSTASV